MNGRLTRTVVLTVCLALLIASGLLVAREWKVTEDRRSLEAWQEQFSVDLPSGSPSGEIVSYLDRLGLPHNLGNAGRDTIVDENHIPLGTPLIFSYIHQPGSLIVSDQDIIIYFVLDEDGSLKTIVWTVRDGGS